MNIAILIPQLAGGGAERVASLIGNYYVEKGHNVYYFLANNTKKSVYEVKGKIIYTDIQIDDRNPAYLIVASLIMRKYKIKYKIDVSISFMEQFNYINILSKGKDRVIARICTILSQRKEWQQSYLYNSNVIRFMYNHADKVVVMTDYAVNEMVKHYGIKKNKLSKISNPVRRLENSPDNSQWQYGSNTIICVGRLEDVKQHNVAIRSFSMVVEQIPSAKLIILGIGPNVAKLKSLVHMLKMDEYVYFLGFKKDINYYLEHSKIFLLTSKTEGFPNSMLEAMSMGVPTISIDSPGAPREILKGSGGDYGIITPYINHNYLGNKPITDNEKKLSEAMINLLSDKNLHAKYSKAALERANMYDIDKVMEKWNLIIGKTYK